MSLNDEALLQEFVVESREHLSSIEPDLLTLEQAANQQSSSALPVDQELINRVFRAIHSIKGASGFFGLEALKSLSHSMESMLMLIRDGKLTPNAAIMDPLLIGVDRLRLMLDDIGNSESVEYLDIVHQLDTLMNNGGVDPNETVSIKNKNPDAKAALTAMFEPDKLSVESALKQGHKLFVIQVHSDTDLIEKDRNPLQFFDALLSTGSVLDTAVDMSDIGDLGSSLKGTLPLLFLYSSVLEKDLLAISLDLEEEQVYEVEAAEVLDIPAVNQVKQKLQAQEEAQHPEHPAANTAGVTVPEPASALKQDPSAVLDAGKSAANATELKKPATTPSAEAESVRVRVDLLNRLMDLAGEMVLARNQLLRAFDETSHQNDQASGLNGIIQNINLVTSDLQEHIMQTRMQPIATVFGKFPRVVRDLAKHLGKEIELEMYGKEVELDKSILESLSDPLTHLIRNCCDHAMELPDEREKAGKPRQGTVVLNAYQESGHINIAITDDGRGIDPEKIVKKAIANGAISEADARKLSPQEQVNLIFLPGLSTAEKISDVSGRGVGMDVVRTNIEQVGGSISIQTELGKGTTILLKLPLTLAIIPSLVVEVEEHRFAIPQINLVELVSVKASEMATKIERVGSAPVLRLRGRLLPLVSLADILQINKTFDDPFTLQKKLDSRRSLGDRRQADALPDELVNLSDDDTLSITNRRLKANDRRENPQRDYNILVLKVDKNQYGLIVDDIKDIEEIVVKPLSSFIKSCKCFSGATIMGDGRVAMILDVSGIVHVSGLSFSELHQNIASEEQNAAASKRAGLQDERSLILFKNGIDEIFAIPLDNVLRLEKFQVQEINRVGSKHFLAYRGKSLPLLYLEDYLPVSPLSADLNEAYIILPKLAGNSQVGIVASQIVDTLNSDVTLEPWLMENPGVKGSAVINDQLTVFIDPEGLLQVANIHAHIEQNGFNTEQTAEEDEAWQADRLQPLS